MKKKRAYPYIVISLIVLSAAAGIFAKAAVGGREHRTAAGSSGYDAASGSGSQNAVSGGQSGAAGGEGAASGSGSQNAVSGGQSEAAGGEGAASGSGSQNAVSGGQSGAAGGESAVSGGEDTASGSGGQRTSAGGEGGATGSGERSTAAGGEDAATGSSEEELQEKKKIALTFDDGPDAEYTPMLLDGLAERGVKVTFFVIGKQAQEQPELMQRIVEEGHLIGNHTYNHVDIRHMTETAAKEEIQKANKVIAQFTGEEPSFLRPPFGSGSTKLEKEMEMIQVLWTIDTMDWSCKNEAKICSTVYKEVEENSIILMHDEYPATVRAALSIIDQLQKEGYEFVTVDEIILG